VHRQDLIVATQGRSLWIMDDLTPLHQLTDAVAASDAHLFEPAEAYRMRLQSPGWGAMEGPRGGANPPEGARIHYYLDEAPDEPITLEIRDPDGTVVKTISSADEAGAARPIPQEPGLSRPLHEPDLSYHATPQPYVTDEEDESLPAEAGMNRFVWDLKYPEAFLAEGVHEASPAGGQTRVSVVTGYTGGPYAVPGTYEVTLSGDGWSQTRTLEVRKDPRLETTQAELQALFDFSVRVRDKITEIQRAVERIHAVQGQLMATRNRLEDEALVEEATALIEDLDAVAGELYKHKESGDHAHLHPELTTSYARIYTMLISSDHQPPASARQRFEDLEPQFDRHVGRLQELMETDLAAFNQALRERGVPPIASSMPTD
jgi:hypothetical protein